MLNGVEKKSITQVSELQQDSTMGLGQNCLTLLQKANTQSEASFCRGDIEDMAH